MKRFWKETVILLLQIALFYAIPALGGLSNPMGMVLLLVVLTFLLSILLGALSGFHAKFLYPAAAAVSFIPSIFLFYNETAWIHVLWYFVVSFAGLGVGIALRALGKR